MLLGILEMFGLALVAVLGAGRVQQWIADRRKQSLQDHHAEECMLAVHDFHTRLVQLKAENNSNLPPAQRVMMNQSIDAMALALGDTAQEVAGHYRLDPAGCEKLIRAFDAFSATIQSMPAQDAMAMPQPAPQSGRPAGNLEKTMLNPVADNPPNPGDDDSASLTTEQMMEAMKNNDHEIAELQTELEDKDSKDEGPNLELTETQTNLKDANGEIDYSKIPTLDNSKPETNSTVQDAQDQEMTKDRDLVKQLSGLRKKPARSKPQTAPESETDPETLAADEALKSVEDLADQATAAETAKQL